MGFPIVKHEAKCLALFQLLEQEWVDLENSGIPRWSVNLGKKGIRELKGLISIVNYDGHYTWASRGRGSTSVLGSVSDYAWVWDYYHGMLRGWIIPVRGLL